MTAIYKLDDGTSSMSLSPIDGENVPESRVRQVMTNKSGVMDAYEWGGKQAWEVPFNNLDSAKATLLVNWWLNMTTLTLTFPSDPGDAHLVKINEPTRPPQMWGGDWDSLYAGMITLYEISSISMSVSGISVSGSKSCSSSWSASLSVASTLSCSISLSTSWSMSWMSTSSLSSVSRSCSDSFSYSESRSCSFFSISSSAGYTTYSSCEDKSSGAEVSSCENISIMSYSSSQMPDPTVFGSTSCSMSYWSSSEFVEDISCSVSEGGEYE